MKLRNISYILLTIMMTFAFTSCNNKCKHKETVWIVDVKATCTENGSKHEECTICHEKLDTKEIKALGHTYDNQGICTRCGYVVSTPGLVYELDIDGKGYLVVGLEQSKYDDPALNIVIPEEYNGLPVIGIYGMAFANAENLKSIKIPSSVKSIGDFAFQNCINLTCIEIPDSVVQIGQIIFRNCEKLAKIIVDKNNSVYDSRDNCNGIIETKTNTLISGCGNTVIPFSVTSIAESAFFECTSLTSIEIPDSVTSIGSYAFAFCTNLINVKIPNSIDKIETYTFRDCTNLTSVKIPNSVTKLGEYAFYNCKNLISAELSNNLTRIEKSIFNGCINLTNIVIPNGVTSIGENAFSSTGLVNVVIPNSVNTIENSAFRNCKNLKTIELPNGIKNIEEYAFANCQNLKSIIIPDSVTTMGKAIFENSTNLESVTIPFVGDGINNAYLGYMFGANSYFSNSEYVPSSLKEVIITKATIIDDLAFASCQSLKKVVIPNSVTTIGNSIFGDCTSLEKITIPFIGDGTNNAYLGYMFGANSYFSNSEYVPSSLKEVIITKATIIDTLAFTQCENLTYIEIPNTVKAIRYSAFYECSGLISIKIPASVTNIEDGAFTGCINVSSITVDENNSVYDSRNNCNALIETKTNTLIFGCNNTIIPNDITKIGTFAFYCCEDLINIEIPDSVTSIELAAFQNCTGLISIEIPANVLSIGESAFLSCNSLISIIVNENNPIYDSRNNCNAIIETKTNTLIFGCNNTIIPNTVVSIESFAFCGCISLKSILIPNSVISIGDHTFDSCYSLVSITVDENNPVYDSRDNCNALIETKTNKLLLGCNNTVIPNTITIIGDSAFSGCTEITTIEIPYGVTSIGSNAFSLCIGLTNVVIPSTVTSIRSSAFAWCVNLTEIKIPASVTKFEYCTFMGCNNLTNVYYGGTLEDWKKVHFGDEYYANPMNYAKHLFVLDENNEYVEAILEQ